MNGDRIHSKMNGIMVWAWMLWYNRTHSKMNGIRKGIQPQGVQMNWNPAPAMVGGLVQPDHPA